MGVIELRLFEPSRKGLDSRLNCAYIIATIVDESTPPETRVPNGRPGIDCGRNRLAQLPLQGLVRFFLVCGLRIRTIFERHPLGSNGERGRQWLAREGYMRIQRRPATMSP